MVVLLAGSRRVPRDSCIPCPGTCTQVPAPTPDIHLFTQLHCKHTVTSSSLSFSHFLCLQLPYTHVYTIHTDWVLPQSHCAAVPVSLIYSIFSSNTNTHDPFKQKICAISAFFTSFLPLISLHRPWQHGNKAPWKVWMIIQRIDFAEWKDALPVWHVTQQCQSLVWCHSHVAGSNLIKPKITTILSPNRWTREKCETITRVLKIQVEWQQLWIDRLPFVAYVMSGEIPHNT